MTRLALLLVLVVGCGDNFAPSGLDAGAAPVLGPAQCYSGDDCESGICEGQGCTDDMPGMCRPVGHRCSPPRLNRVPYCGCDGELIYGIGDNCPGDRYQHEGECQ